MIISASRRTDIPAFYSEWFMNRVREGFLLVRNPFNAKQISRVSMIPEDVDVIVFWTRNPAPLAEFLDELDDLGHKYYFQFTITGYPRELEPNTLSPYRAIEVFNEFSDRLGSELLVWRYDPILLCNLVSLEEHKRLFTKIASMIAGKTRRCVISFADLYSKSERNLKTIKDISYSDILSNQGALQELVSFMAKTANENGMEIKTCAEDACLEDIGVLRGKCIDDELIQSAFGISVDNKKDAGQREACGCIRSIDIGMYNTCLHGCAYCYATHSHASVEKNRARHDVNSPFLVGDAVGVDPTLLQAPERQERLF